jgi:hypothetical protein
MRKAIWAAAAASMALVSTAAFATVTFDPTTGVGFVGKGDVQIAFGWNNSQLQKNASGVTFTYNETDVYDVTCEWETVTGGPHSQTIVHDVDVPRHISINANVAFDPRTRNQITGFNLTGDGYEVDDATPPTIGATCPGNSGVGLVVDFQLVSSNGGLYTNYGGNSVLLNWPVVI